jgi:hypothetical protein
MQVRINGEQQDLPVELRRGATPIEGEQLHVGDWQVTRVTHSLVDDIPVIVQVDDLVIEVDRQSFYSIAGMNQDWQPGSSSQSLTAG